MWRFLGAVILGVTVGTSGPALAQPSSGKDDRKQIEAEVAKLRKQIADLEARLQKSKLTLPSPKKSGKGGEKAPGGKKGFGPWGGGRPSAEKMKEMKEW